MNSANPEFISNTPTTSLEVNKKSFLPNISQLKERAVERAKDIYVGGRIILATSLSLGGAVGVVNTAHAETPNEEGNQVCVMLVIDGEPVDCNNPNFNQSVDLREVMISQGNIMERFFPGDITQPTEDPSNLRLAPR